MGLIYLLPSLIHVYDLVCVQLLVHLTMLHKLKGLVFKNHASVISCRMMRYSVMAQKLTDGYPKPNQAKPSQSVNWGRRLAPSAKRKSASPCLLAIPAFDRIAGLNNRYLDHNKGICLR